VVVYNGDVYRAPVGIQAGDPVPGATGSPWAKVDISGGLKVANDDGSLPSTAPAGQVWIVLSSATAGGEQALYAYDHGAQQWQELGGGGQPLDFTNSVELIGVGVPVGSVTAYAGTTLPDGWLLCDGGSFRQQDYPELYVVLGNRTTLPDLRRQFIRGGNLHDDHYSHHDDTTRMPHNGFRATAGGGHSHSIRTVGDETSNGWVASGAGGWSTTVQSPEAVLPASDHVHAITGGDSETAPKHVVMAYIIKAVDRTVRLR
jgi:microcystin-dependent protein